MDAHESLATQAAAVNALAEALAKRVGDNEITDNWEALRFVQDWAAAVASVQMPAAPRKLDQCGGRDRIGWPITREVCSNPEPHAAHTTRLDQTHLV